MKRYNDDNSVIEETVAVKRITHESPGDWTDKLSQRLKIIRKIVSWLCFV